MDLIDREHLISVICNNCTAQERCKANNEEGECDDFDMMIIRNEPMVIAVPVVKDMMKEIHFLEDIIKRCKNRISEIENEVGRRRILN